MQMAMSKNVKRIAVLLAFGLAYGFIYTLPYMRFTFYDQMIAAMGCTNAQLGWLMSLYAIACTASYLPGGWIADRFSCKNILVICMFAQAALCFVFMFTYTNFLISQIIWFLCAITGGFAFWPAMLKGVRLLGTKEEHGRLYGIFEGLNGFASVIVNLCMIAVLSIFVGDLVQGFKGACATMGILCVVAGVLLLWLFDDHLTESESEEDEEQAIKMKDFLTVFKIPAVWLAAILMFCQVFYISGMTLLTPYSTAVLGLPLGLASLMGTLRAYAARFVGGPLGGVAADKVFHSASKNQLLAYILCAGIMAMFLILPSGTPGVILVILSLVDGVALYMEKGPLYAVLPELGVSRKVTGTAIALMTLIGYLPDMFVHTIFGNWLDVYGNDGYNYIFTACIAIACVGIVMAVICVMIANRHKKNTAASAGAQA